jgi:hypothetical protein
MKSFIKLGAGFLIVVFASILLIFWLTAGEDPELEKLYSTLLMDARSHEPAQVLSFFTTSYNHNGMNYGALARLVNMHMTPDSYDSIEEKDRKIRVQGDYLAFIEAEYVIVKGPMRVPLKVRLRLEKDSGRWLITAADYQELPTFR